MGVNLRFDLKRLSDLQLAALLERSWQRFETAKSSAKSYTLRASARGPINHPWAFNTELRFSSVEHDLGVQPQHCGAVLRGEPRDNA